MPLRRRWRLPPATLSAGVYCRACGVEAELEAYAPLVRSVAWRYAGRGAFYGENGETRRR